MATIRKLRGRWQAQVRRRGVAPRAKSFDSKAVAQRWAQDLEAEANRSGWVADTRLAEKTTVRELLTRYCAEVTPGKRGAVSHAIEIATREWGLWLPRNPVKLVRRPQVPRGRTRRLKVGEEARLLAACDSGRTPMMKPLIILAIETAMRRGEMLDLRWQHVDLVRCVAHLPLTKNGDSRDIPLSRRAVAILKELKADKGRDAERVFPVTGNSIRLAFEHLRVRAGMDDFRFHDLRHEGISRLFELGLNIAEVSAISGHRELKMLMRYTHLRAVDLVSRLG